MTLLIIFILILGFVGLIGNQTSGLKRMNEMQRSLDEINQKLREMNNKK
ncbi:hypothetical protein [Paenibacillus psychroresistens]|nr:hypothetical protein [Paenibacillus psychroresistens]